MFVVQELIDVVVMTLAVGYIFSDFFHPKASAAHDPIGYWSHAKATDLKFAMAVTAPAIVLHELLHKLVALGFGLDAIFHAAYNWLGFGVILKLLNTGIIFFVPGFVQIVGSASNLEHLLIAAAGPFTNLALFAICSLTIKYKRGLSTKWIDVLGVSKKLNLFLFGFNMLPIPPFDGFTVFSSLFHLIFG